MDIMWDELTYGLTDMNQLLHVIIRLVAAITGIGFIGTGSILKLSEEKEIQELTTVAGIWMTAAIGVAVGLGSLGVALLSTLFILIILSLVGQLEQSAENMRMVKIQEKKTE